MGFKVKHYATKTVAANSSLEWELILTELIIGSLCAAFAKVSYDATMLLIFIPNLVIALVCFGFIGLSIFHFIREKRSKPSE
ncbi:hypothetical protein [Pseudoalteromonas sp. T1lg122]|uniref:hypothetical protein n=1 Tax=Pseudoalteromonas sp. T1lg122 TaxID=2077094 RepID=UPI000CF5FBFB|nr:hypothetical protein [Pseudoalteromonas sp. T1lg122]